MQGEQTKRNSRFVWVFLLWMLTLLVSNLLTSEMAFAASKAATEEDVPQPAGVYVENGHWQQLLPVVCMQGAASRVSFVVEFSGTTEGGFQTLHYSGAKDILTNTTVDPVPDYQTASFDNGQSIRAYVGGPMTNDENTQRFAHYLFSGDAIAECTEDQFTWSGDSWDTSGYTAAYFKVFTAKDAGEYTFRFSSGSKDVKDNAQNAGLPKTVTCIIQSSSAQDQAISGVEDSYTLTNGEDNTLTLAPATTGDGTFSYSSSDTDVVEVNANGVVTPKTVGEEKTATVTITASDTVNYKKATKTVSITVKPASSNKEDQTITLSPASGTYNAEEGTLDVTFSEDGKVSLGAAATGTLTYSSSNADVAVVSESGELSMKGDGETTVTVYAASTDAVNATSKTLKVTVAPIAIAKPQAEMGTVQVGEKAVRGLFEFAGQPVTGVKAGAGYTLSTTFSGTKLFPASRCFIDEDTGDCVATDACFGSYVGNSPVNTGYYAMASLKSGYIWDDNSKSDVTVYWGIRQKSYTITAEYTDVELALSPIDADESSTVDLSGLFTAEGIELSNLSPQLTGDAVTLEGWTATAAKAGTATVTVTSTNSNYGQDGNATTFTITVAGKNLKASTVSASYEDEADVTYNGSAQLKSIVVKDGEETLVEGTHYTVEWPDDVTNVSESGIVAKVKGKAEGGYTGTVTMPAYFIDPSKVTVSGITAADKAYDGTVDATLDVSGASLSGVVSKDAGKVSVKSASGKFADANAGADKAVTVTAVELDGESKGNYELSAMPTDVKATISKAAQAITLGKDSYSVTAGSAAFNLGAATNGDGALGYKSDNEAVASVTAAGLVTPKAAGKATITVSADATGNYEAATPKTVMVTVSKAAQAITLKQTAYNVTAGSAAFSLGATTNGDGALGYKSDNEAVASVTAAGLVTPKAAGKATITVSAAETAKYSAAAPKTVTVTVSDKPLVSIAKATVTPAKKKYTYTAKAIKPAVTVKLNGAALKSGTDFTVSYSKNTNIGTATVTVAGKGAYTGTAKATFKIVAPTVAKSAVSKATPGKKKLTLTLKKVSGATSYKISYRVKGTSKWSTKTVKTAKATLTKLKAGKRYQVKVVAQKKIGSKTFSSAASAVKTTGKVKGSNVSTKSVTKSSLRAAVI